MFDETTQIEVSGTFTFNEAEIESVNNNAERSDDSSENSRQDAGAEPSLSIDVQANLLRELFHEFKSLADRACDTALREAQHSAQVEELAGAELINLRLQLKEKDEAIESRDRAQRERDAVAKEKIDSLENILRDKDAQLENCHGRSRALLGEIDGLNVRLNEAATAMKLAEIRFRDFAEHQQGAISELRNEVVAKENLLQLKDVALRRMDEGSRVTIRALETQLQIAKANLETKEGELRESETALQTLAAREETVTQLMEQLAAESQNLMAELREKNLLVSGLESKMHRSCDNGIAGNNGASVQ
jgi:hypothetical protein